MASLLQIYGIAVLASVSLGAGLALLGCHLAARDRALQTLCVGQGATLGVLLGLGLTSSVLSEEALFWSLPFGLSLVVAGATYYGSEALVAGRAVARGTQFAALFAALLAGTGLMGALFPALEGHLAQRYFGDFATLGQADAWLALAIGATLLATLGVMTRRLGRDGFAAAVLGVEPEPGARGTAFWLALGTLLVLGFSVQTVGLPYTVACLFVPTALLSRARRPGLKRHLVACAALAGSASGLGFLLSLEVTRLPTVPAIVAVMVLLGRAVLFIT